MVEASKYSFVKRVSNYKELYFYRKSLALYDITYYFCEHFFQKGDRTIDQMVQAARSGKQNIIEGSEAAATSGETEIKLLNVARASLKELQADYEDYLRVRNLETWNETHPRYKKMVDYCGKTNDAEAYTALLSQLNDEAIANMCITLCHQADSMMTNYIATKEKEFVEEGGIREGMTRARIAYRNDHPNNKN